MLFQLTRNDVRWLWNQSAIENQFDEPTLVPYSTRSEALRHALLFCDVFLSIEEVRWWTIDSEISLRPHTLQRNDVQGFDVHWIFLSFVIKWQNERERELFQTRKERADQLAREHISNDACSFIRAGSFEIGDAQNQQGRHFFFFFFGYPSVTDDLIMIADGRIRKRSSLFAWTSTSDKEVCFVGQWVRLWVLCFFCSTALLLGRFSFSPSRARNVHLPFLFQYSFSASFAYERRAARFIVIVIVILFYSTLYPCPPLINNQQRWWSTKRK